MKNSIEQLWTTGSSLLLGLVIVAFSITGSASKASGTERTTEGELEEFALIEIAEETMLVEDRAPKAMFFNNENELVLETSGNDPFGHQLEDLRRTSDLIMEFDGIRYYRVNR